MTALKEFPLKNYFQKIDETTLLTAEQEHELALRVREGDIEARDHMIRANLRLVVFFARRLAGRGMSMEDLIQEGNIGLMRAVEGFNPDVETRFTTYARFWIVRVMRNALEKASTAVRLPGYAIDLVAKWKQNTAKLTDQTGCPPTEEQVARKMNLSPKQLKIVQKGLRIYNATPCASHDENPCENILIDAAITPDNVMADSEETAKAVHLLERLDDREATILRLRFGLGGEEPMILSEIGARLGLTRERVRQIEKLGLGRLRDLIDHDTAA